MSQPFTVIFRSFNRPSGQTTGNCYLTTQTPHDSRYLSCKVIGFFNEVPAFDPVEVTNFIGELKCEDMGIQNEYDTNHRRGSTLAVGQFDRYNSVPRLSFICDNFNNKRLHFEMLTLEGNPMTDAADDIWDYEWVLYIECTPIE